VVRVTSWDGTDEIAAEKERLEKLENQKTWKPEEGEVLLGTLIEAKVVNTDHGESLLVNVNDDDGQTWTVWCGTKVLRESMLDKAPKIGSRLRIEFEGTRQPASSKGRPFKMHYVSAQEEDHEWWANHISLGGQQLDTAVLPGSEPFTNAAGQELVDPFTG
jgi:hypothetical protein